MKNIFHVLWLHGTSSTGNPNTPFTLSSSSFVPLPSWYAYALMFLSLVGRKTSCPTSFISDTASKALCVSATLGFTYLRDPFLSLSCTFRAPRSGTLVCNSSICLAYGASGSRPQHSSGTQSLHHTNRSQHEFRESFSGNCTGPISKAFKLLAISMHPVSANSLRQVRMHSFLWICNLSTCDQPCHTCSICL